jgi:hypothetical protein
MEGLFAVLRRCLLAGSAVAALSVPVLATLTPAVASANSAANTALINGDSIEIAEEEPIMKEGTPISLEQYSAEAAGFKVTIVTGSQWTAMSASEFAQYQVLIVGDPNCGGLPVSVSESVANWAPAVKGSGDGGVIGNRAVVGTDPEDHYQYGNGQAPPRELGNPSTSGAEHLVQSGITFAGAVAGATGMYYDTSCYQQESGGTLPTFSEQLQQISTGPGTWEAGESPACSANISLIASNSAFSGLSDEDLEGWSCSAHVSFASFPADWHALALTLPSSGEGQVCGSDIETKEFHCGNAYVLVAGGGVVAENPFIKLTPPSGNQAAGGSHTVVATVEEEEPRREEIGLKVARSATLIKAAGRVVNFAVTGQNSGVAGVCTTGGGTPDPECKTDANGQVEFTYPDAHGAGADTINAGVSLPNGLQTTTATWEWTPVPVVTPPAVVVATPAASVLPAKESASPKGAAHLASTRACVASNGYLARVSGTAIASVTFTLDGHKVKTLSKPNSGAAFSARIHLRAGSRHHLSIHVVFSAASKTSASTIKKTLARCAAAKVVTKPRFTG